MKIILIGYMGSGKSTVGKLLAKLKAIEFKDLDREIELLENRKIPDIFSDNGEIYFRKKEIETLKIVLEKNTNLVLATGGGTPCYGNTMEFLNSNNKTVTIYLKSSIQTITNRLFEERNQRPLISHLNTKEELHDFISKHLFERSYYYNQASIKTETDHLSVEEVVESIQQKLSF
ncbi:MAG: shikimate kinase [Flavobacterium sp.]|nr:MAG: shikimate kinase [Flavobacterium sp.]